MSTIAMSENITTKIENGILYLTINREIKLNALNIATLKDIKWASSYTIFNKSRYTNLGTHSRIKVNI